MKILTLVDGSEHSLKALDYAINLLASKNSDSNRYKNNKIQSNYQLIILNILQPLQLSEEVIQGFKSINSERKNSLHKYLKDINSAMKDTWIKKLSDLKSKYDKTGVLISTKIVKGTHSSRFVAYSIIKFVENVYKISFSGYQAAKCGQEIIYVTERAVFRLDNNELVLEEIAPGIDIEKDVLSRMNFKPQISKKIKEMDIRLFRKSPMNIKNDLVDF